MMGIQKREAPVVRYYWSPSNMMDEMDKMISDMRQLSSDWLPHISQGTRVPAVDIREESDRYLVEAEMPGVAKGEVEVHVGEGVLEIGAKHETSTEEKKEGYLRRERSSLDFFRRMGLPEDVDQDNVTAKLEDGLLHVTLLKKAPPVEKKSKVEVQ
jgi:HSP20 family protein